MMVPYEEPRERRRPRQQNRAPRPNSPGPASAALVVYNPQQRQVAPARQPRQEFTFKGPLHMRPARGHRSGGFRDRSVLHTQRLSQKAGSQIDKEGWQREEHSAAPERNIVATATQAPPHNKGGDLFDLATGTVRQPEGGVRRLISGLVDAVNYLHSRHVVHRDIKAEHIMFARDGDPNSPIKIIDFGVATLHKPGDPPLNAFAGSLRSVAPEVIKRSYDNQCDMWSVGIVTFFLLTQQMPFNGGTNQEIFQKICSGRFFFPRWTEQGLSEEAKDFIDDLLVLDPRERMTSREALAHPWIRGQRSEIAPPQQRGRTKSRSLKQIPRPQMPQQIKQIP
ncbi:hypothetical protein THAOC_02753, partial [Thalassiosira oceanica]